MKYTYASSKLKQRISGIQIPPDKLCVFIGCSKNLNAGISGPAAEQKSEKRTVLVMNWGILLLICSMCII